MNYRITWTIDIEADSPVLAAREALKTQQDKESTATVFDVETDDRKRYRVDLSDEVPAGRLDPACLTREQLVKLVGDIQDKLWGGDPNTDWEAETIEDVAEVMNNNGLWPVQD